MKVNTNFILCNTYTSEEMVPIFQWLEEVRERSENVLNLEVYSMGYLKIIH